jgi:thiamine-monophosphate kinase
MVQRLKDLGEFEFIRRIARTVSKREGTLLGIGDDAAVLRSSTKDDLLFTTDMLIEGVHFTRQMDPQDIGHKAIACSISDVAAMGGRPTFAVVSIGVSAKLNMQYVQRLYDGMNRIARRFRVGIVGGDTVRSSQIVINVALLGTVKRGQVIKRSGAKAGEHIFLTGAIGGSFQSGWHLTFTPRLKEAQYLVRKFHPTAMIDISDGLAADLGHILEQSHVGAVIDAKSIPRLPKVSLQAALDEGEDFELIFTLSPQSSKRLLSFRPSPYRFYKIGEITPSCEGFQLVDERGKKQRIEPQGYRHF